MHRPLPVTGDPAFADDATGDPRAPGRYALGRRGRAQWRYGTISNNPVWKVPTIYRWANETGRTIIWHPWPGLDDAGEPTQSEHELTIPEM